jgi:hypothetical protein
LEVYRKWKKVAGKNVNSPEEIPNPKIQIPSFNNNMFG